MPSISWKFLGLLGVASLAGWAVGNRPVMVPPAIAADIPNARVRGLLEERSAMLKDYYKAQVEQPDAGNYARRDLERNLRLAQRAVEQAELDLCETRAQRIAVLEKIVDNAKRYEQLAPKLPLEPDARPLPLWQLPPGVVRLEAEIALERELAR